MKPNSSRRMFQLLGLTTIILLIVTLLFMFENKRKDAQALYQMVTEVVGTNQMLVAPDQTATLEAFLAGFNVTRTAEMASTQTAMPYDPTIYWARQTETWLLITVGGPTEYAIFYATETALRVTGWQTVTPSAQPTVTP